MLAGHDVLYKTMMSKMCTETQLPFGMSIIISAALVGSVLAPAFGGYLAFPNEQYPGTFGENPVFGKFVALLPSVVIGVGCAVGILMCHLYLPSEITRQGDDVEMKETNVEETAHQDVVVNEHVVKDGIISNNKELSGEVTQNMANKENVESSSEEKIEENSVLSRLTQSDIYIVLNTKESIISLLLIGVWSFIGLAFLEVFPIFATTSTRYHGLGFNESKLGLVMLIEGW